MSVDSSHGLRLSFDSSVSLVDVRPRYGAAHSFDILFFRSQVGKADIDAVFLGPSRDMTGEQPG